MDTDEDIEYDYESNLGRCRVCNTNWMKSGNIRSHTTQPRHKSLVQAAAERRKAAASHQQTGPSRRAYVEDIWDDDDNSYNPDHLPSPFPKDWTFDTPDSPPDVPFSLSEAVQNFLAAVSDPNVARQLAGQAPDDEVQDALDDALSGLPVYRAALWQGDDEAPAILDGILDDEGSLEDLFELPDPEHPVPSAQEVSEKYFGATRPSADYFPYPNKSMMKTDILFSSPRLRFSRAQQEAILAWGKELGAREVPSLYALEKFQKEALSSVGNPTVRVETPSGNILYMNDPMKLLAKMYGHRSTREKLRSLPEYTPNQVSEVWQADKWLYEVPDHVLTPMIRIQDQDFYINELVYCSDATWFIPERFFESSGKTCAVGRAAKVTSQGLLVDDRRTVSSCEKFTSNWPAIEAANPQACLFHPSSAHFAAQMPNPDRQISQGLEWECPPLIVFIDDVSGNSTKQWNVHYSCYMSHGGLPRSEIEKERNVHFVATSPHASPMEIMHAVCDSIRASGGLTPTRVWDAMKERYIMLRPWILFLPGDNPMQAELCSHIGMHGNYFCRCCGVGGTQEHKRSDDGFASLLKPGAPRKVEETREAIQRHLRMSTQASAEKAVKDAVTSTGVKDSFANPLIDALISAGKTLRRQAPGRSALSPSQVHDILKEELRKYSETHPVENPLLSMPGLDVHKDTPVEPLHTMLLGVVKYFWAQTMWVLEKNKQLPLFQVRLNALESSGLKIPNIMADYMCRYRGGLIGKHFKTISQIMVFAVAGLVSEDLKNTWVAIGRLTGLIWETTITDVKAYLAELDTAISDVLDFAATQSPSILMTKIKFHILTHLVEHVRRFGTAVLFSTERYESFNRIFRLCSIHSNRQAPSRDIAGTFANMERCRHIVTGGHWYDDESGTWVQAGRDVLRYIREHPLDARLLGVPLEKDIQPGTMTLPPRLKDPETKRPRPHSSLTWQETEASRHLHAQARALSGAWFSAASLTTTTGDTAYVGCEVIVRTEKGEYSPLEFASIQEILAPAEPASKPLVLLRSSALELELHPQLHVPVLLRTGPYLLCNPEDLVCIVNLQHDCLGSACQPGRIEAITQERQHTTRAKTMIQHTNSVRFVVNMFALHNRRWIRKALPRRLCESAPFFSDRSSLHASAAASLRDVQLQKKLAKEAAARKTAEDARRAVHMAEEDAVSVPPNDLGETAVLGERTTDNDTEAIGSEGYRDESLNHLGAAAGETEADGDEPPENLHHAALVNIRGPRGRAQGSGAGNRGTPSSRRARGAKRGGGRGGTRGHGRGGSHIRGAAETDARAGGDTEDLVLPLRPAKRRR